MKDALDAPHGLAGRASATFAYLRHPLHCGLLRAIESHVIPGLVRALSCRPGAPAETRAWTARSSTTPISIAPIDDDARTALVTDLVQGHRSGCIERIDHLILQGLRVEHIFLELLAPAAVRLNRLYTEDTIGLADASLGFCTLQFLLRHFRQPFRTEQFRQDAGQRGRRALLVSPNAEMNGLTLFGLRLLSEFFRRDGWSVQIERDIASEAFVDLIRSQWFDVIEILATSETDLDATADGIQMIRRTSLNQATDVVVCGEPFLDSSVVRQVGADRLVGDPLACRNQALLLG